MARSYGWEDRSWEEMSSNVRGVKLVTFQDLVKDQKGEKDNGKRKSKKRRKKRNT